MTEHSDEAKVRAAIRGVLVVWVLATGLGLGQEPPKINMKAFTVLHLAGWGWEWLTPA